MKKCTTISLAIFLGVVLLSANGLAAAVTKLNDIRGGQHKGYTRLVLDAEGARPLKIGPTTAGGVTIVYKQLDLMRTSSALLRNMIGAVANVRHHRQANRSVIAITFKDPNTAAKSFYMGGKSAEKSAYRLIIDLYPRECHSRSRYTGPGCICQSRSSADACIGSSSGALTPGRCRGERNAIAGNESVSTVRGNSTKSDRDRVCLTNSEG